MPLYQKIVDLASNTANNSNGNMTRGAIYCPDQLSVSGVSIFNLLSNNFLTNLLIVFYHIILIPNSELAVLIQL